MSYVCPNSQIASVKFALLTETVVYVLLPESDEYYKRFLSRVWNRKSETMGEGEEVSTPEALGPCVRAVNE